MTASDTFTSLATVIANRRKVTHKPSATTAFAIANSLFEGRSPFRTLVTALTTAISCNERGYQISEQIERPSDVLSESF